MDDNKNLDDYLAGLGISEADEAALPVPPQAGPSGEEEGGTALWAAPGTLGAQETLQQFLTGLLSRIDPELKLTIQQGDGALEAEIQGAQAARLAGRDGRVLAAVEVLAYAALSRQGHTEVRVRIDAGGFRKRHAENLGKVAERLALQVAKTGEAHEMQPMPPADRRVFHLALQEHALVQTESIGEGTARRLVILPRSAPLADGQEQEAAPGRGSGGQGTGGQTDGADADGESSAH